MSANSATICFNMERTRN